MTRAKCPDCAFVSVHERLMTAKAMLGKHRKKEHGYIRPGQKYYKGYKPLADTEPRNSEVVPVEGKRPYARKAPPALAVSLCPVCGCDIHAVNVAINLRRGK